MTHRIRRQILELDLPREQGAHALQQRASRVFQEQVLPELDKLFSRIAPADRIVRLDRLEVDLGDIGESGWERRFVEQCLEKIARQVADAAFEVGEAGQQPETLTPAENALRVIAFFLETGTLPWYAKGLTLKELEETLNAQPIEDPTLFSRWLLPLLQRDERAVQRLVQQFSAVFSEKILAAVLGLDEAWVSRAVQIRQQQMGRVLNRSERAVLYQILLRCGGPALQQLPPEPAVLARFFEEEMPQPVVRKRAQEPAPSGKNTVRNPRPDEAEFTSSASANDSEPAGGAVPRPARREAQPDEQIVSKRPPSFPEVPQAASKKTAAAIAEGMAVESAGLVLFAPYLSAFFAHLGLQLAPLSLEGDLFLDASSPHARAVHLLHYLATGEEQPEEQRLVFPKILCGIPLEMPVPQDLTLSETEKAEAENLLEAVVRNWPALKNTSTEGLRNGFVRRNGLLRWQEDRQAWVLQVERLAHDILLDRLPWTISVVRLPWMTGMIQVEW